MNYSTKLALLLLAPAISLAQVPVDDDGNVIGQYESAADGGPLADGEIPLLTPTELQDLVGPIALYPDDLLAIVLPASAYPLQVVEAARFLEAHETDSSLEPNPDWDDSIVALINYPEVVELMNDDLDWTLRLGEAVVAQQGEVVAAVEAFRDRAYAAGNLKSDSYQTVSREDDAIYISPAEEDVIYVPYYEPAQVVYYQPRPVYYYHPRAYPVYYYPYAAGHHFNHGYFWGVTTAFSIGWLSDSLHVYHHSYRGHPYYGRSYWDTWWYRRPSISIYNRHYVNRRNYNVNRYSHGDRWQARNTRREYIRREGYSRASSRADRREDTLGGREARRAVSTSRTNVNSRTNSNGRTSVAKTRQREPISFRQRDTELTSRIRRNTTNQAERNSTSRVGDTTRQRNASGSTARQDRVENRREASQVVRSGNTGRITSQSRTQQSSNRTARSVTRNPVTTQRAQRVPAQREQREQRQNSSRLQRQSQARAPAQQRQPQVRAPVQQRQVQRSETRSQSRSAPPQANNSSRRSESTNSGTRAAPERRSSQQSSRSRGRKER